MDTLTAIMTRRSIRKYEPKPVPDDLVQKVLAAAMNAPSAGNQQPWHFIVVNGRKTLDAIAKIHRYAPKIRKNKSRTKETLPTIK